MRKVEFKLTFNERDGDRTLIELCIRPGVVAGRGANKSLSMKSEAW
jgi:hypothetical protein